MADLSKSIQVQASKKLQAEEVTQLSEWATKFMLLLRDMILESTGKKGTPCHVKDFLLQKISNSNGLVLSPSVTFHYTHCGASVVHRRVCTQTILQTIIYRNIAYFTTWCIGTSRR